MVAAACLFFACKVEEQPRRLRDFIDSIQRLFHKGEPLGANNAEVILNFYINYYFNQLKTYFVAL
jgi:hypothetical protein